MSLAERYEAPKESRCSIGAFEDWLAENHPADVATYQAMKADPKWSDRRTLAALREEYGRDESQQQFGHHRRGGCACVDTSLATPPEK